MRVPIVAMVLVVLMVSGAQAQEPLKVGSIAAAAGTMASGTLEVAARGGDQGTTIPVTIINGLNDSVVPHATAAFLNYTFPNTLFVLVDGRH